MASITTCSCCRSVAVNTKTKAAVRMQMWYVFFILFLNMARVHTQENGTQQTTTRQLDINTTTPGVTIDTSKSLTDSPTDAGLNVDTQPDTDEEPYTSASTRKNCSLFPKDPNVVMLVKDRIIGGAKLIKYTLDVENLERAVDIASLNKSYMYKPFFWVRTTGRQGRGLLLLKDDYHVLSLTTLDIGVEKMNVTLRQSPEHCLRGLSPYDIEELIRELVMNDFQNTSSGEFLELGNLESVCNMHVDDVDGSAEFAYKCCDRGPGKNIVCMRLAGDFWLNVLLVLITSLKVLVILFSPRFIPDSWYRLKYLASPYLHKLRDEPLKINVALTKSPERYPKAKTVFKLSKFRHMNEFKKGIQNMLYDVVYSLSMKTVSMQVKAIRIIPQDYAPVGLFKSLFETFVRCKVREKPSVRPCCHSEFCGESRPFVKSVPWFRILKELMHVFTLCVFVLPWFLRVYIYFKHEHTENEGRRNAALERNLKFGFPGSFTLYLTPLHVIFITIYVLLSVESVVYGILKQKIKERFKFVLRKCFRDMRERDQLNVIGWAALLALKPCTQHGIFGIGLGLVLWVIGFPLIFSILAFYIFPTLNLTVRLLAHFCVYLCPRDACRRNNAACIRLNTIINNFEKAFEVDSISSFETLEKDHKVMSSKYGRLGQLCVILMCLLSMYSVIFLITELISFVVEVIIYTMMGIILNASSTLTYVSLLIMLGVYGGDSYGFVSKRYLAFNSTMNSHILSLGREKVENVIYEEENVQNNLAFRVRTDHNEILAKPVELVKSGEGYPRWQVNRMLLFLSKRDVPLIPSKFFFDACKMPFFSCPGEVLISYARASAEFGFILVFLLFVLIVVLAFGESYEVSGTNQLLATVAGGFLPLMLRKVLFKSRAVPTVDTSSINFHVIFNRLLDNYTQTWPIYDILVNSKQVLDEESDNTVLVDQPKASELITCAVVDENQPFLDEPHPVVNVERSNITTPVDLLIDVREINLEDFPGMQSTRNFDVGSTSLIDDIEQTLEMEDLRRESVNNGSKRADVV